MVTSVPFAMRMRADDISMCVSFGVAEQEIGLTRTTFECPKVCDAAGLAFLYTQNGYQKVPFRPSQPQDKLRPSTSHTPRLFGFRRRVFRCGVNQTSAKYCLESVLQPNCTGGRSVVLDNPGRSTPGNLLQLQNNDGPLFVLHDGPPYANGNLHMGIIVSMTEL